MGLVVPQLFQAGPHFPGVVGLQIAVPPGHDLEKVVGPPGSAYCLASHRTYRQAAVLADTQVQGVIVTLVAYRLIHGNSKAVPRDPVAGANKVDMDTIAQILISGGGAGCPRLPPVLGDPVFRHTRGPAA